VLEDEKALVDYGNGLIAYILVRAIKCVLQIIFIG
jgi:hypothetical protein